MKLTLALEWFINPDHLPFVVGLDKNLSKKNNIQFIFHAAAYKHVKFLEENILSAVENNISGTNNILKAIKNTKINLTFISTDKAVRPTNTMGAT